MEERHRNYRRTNLDFYPWRRRAVPLDNAIHEKLFASDKRVTFLAQPSDRLASTFDLVENTRDTRFLHRV